MSTRQIIHINILAALIIVSAFAVTWVKEMHRSEFVRHDLLQDEHHKLQTEWGRLQLEYSAFVMGGNIESLARHQVGMEYPKDIIAVEIR